MKNSIALALTAALALTVAHSPAQAAPAVEATMLEAVVVTPTARYTAGEWQAHVVERNAVVLDRVIVTPVARYSVAEWTAKKTLVAVTLDPVIVTPTARYTVAEWQQRQSGLTLVKHTSRVNSVKVWLKTVWKHFQFKRTPVEV